MRERVRARAVPFLVSMLVLVLACDGTAPPEDTLSEVGLYSEALLRIDAGPAEALVAINGRVAVTVRHFNDRLMEFAVEDRSQEVSEARLQVLDQMIDYQLIVLEGQRRHPDLTLDASSEGSRYDAQRRLAQRVIRESVGNPDIVSDAEARTYLLEKGSDLSDLAQKMPSQEEQLLMAKVMLIDERWRAQLAAWRSENRVEVFEEHLEERRKDEVDS